MPVSLKIVLPLLKVRLDVDTSDFTSLNKLLSKGVMLHDSIEDWEALLFSKFGINKAGQDLPVAAVCRSGEQGKQAFGCWLRLDPVHMRAGLNDSILYHPNSLDISELELDALFLQLQDHFDDYTFEKSECHHWYVKLPQAISLKTNSLDQVTGGFVGARLPSGADAGPWLSFLNEVQMLFFEHPVNQQREQLGKLSVNSVWPFGGGEAPGQVPACFDRIYSDELLAKGLAVASETDFEALPDSILNLLVTCKERDKKNVLLVSRCLFDAQLLDDSSQFVKAMSHFEQHWFRPLLESLRRGDVKQLELEFATGKRFVITPAMLRYFWRPIKSFKELI